MATRKLDQFDDGVETFINYKERLDAYFIANDVNDDKRAATLLSTIGPHTYNILRSLTQPEQPITKTYDDLCKLLTDHFCPKPLEIVERFKFHKRDQGQSESLSDYLASLKKMAEHCNFGESLNTTLRDRYVCGIRDEGIQRRLLQETDLSLSRAVEISLAMETAQADAGYIQQPSAIHRLTTGSKPTKPNISYDNQNKMNPHAKPRNHQKPWSTPSQQSACQSCGKTNHERAACYFRNASCRRCGRKGHIQSVCRSARNHQIDAEERTNDAESQDESDVFHLYNIGSRPDKFWVHSTINHQKISMELDTGSALSVMTMGQYKCIFRKIPHLKQTNIILKTYTGEKISPLGYSEVTVKLNGQTRNLNLYILKKGSNAIFGREWLSQLRIDWKEIKQVNLQGNAESIAEKLKHEFAEVFGEGVGTMTRHKAQIRVKPDATPKFMKARTVPYSLKQKVEDELENLEKQGIISKVDQSEWATPIVPILKPNGEVRICGDFKVTINKDLEEESYTLPRLEDMLVNLEKGDRFSKLDIRKAYLTLPLTDDSKKLTTINTHKGLYCFNRMVFGVTSCPAIWQKTIDQVLLGLKGVQCNQDDILITGRDDDEHLNNLKSVLSRLQKHGLKVNLPKCKFFAKDVIFCGIKISAEGLHKTDDKVRAVVNAPIPTDKTQLRSFLGLVNYYHKWLPNIAHLAKPLYELLQDKVQYKWTGQCSKAFTEIKQLVSSDKVLMRYDPNLPLRLACDASPYGIGSVLSHITEQGDERPIAYISRTLNPSEKNYSQLDKEALAIVWSVKKFYNYLCSRHFTLISDHLPLKFIFNPKKGIPAMSAARQQRYAVFLSGFNYTIEYRRSEQNANADSLSRLPLPVTAKDEEGDADDLFYNTILNSGPVNSSMIAMHSRNDTTLAKVITFVKNNVWPSKTSISEELIPFFHKRTELTVQQDCLLWGYRVIPPQKLRDKILNTLHFGHLGIVKMKNLARGYIWWPNMDKEIEELAKACHGCTTSQPDPPKAPLHPWHSPQAPWQRIHVDFAGPFLNSMFFIVVDAYSKWVEILPTQSTTSQSTIEMLSSLFARFGICEQLVSDNGPQLASTEFRTFLKDHGVRQIFSPPYHPATNGLAERMVKSFKQAMKSSKNEKGTLQNKLSKFLLAYRNAPHASTNETPSFLMFNRHLRTPLDILRPNMNSKFVDCQLGSQSMTRARQFKVGDHVLVRDYRGQQRWQHARVVEGPGPYIYRVETTPGVIWNRHIDQMVHTNSSKDVSEEVPPMPQTSISVNAAPSSSVLPIPEDQVITNEAVDPTTQSTTSVEFSSSPNEQAELRGSPVGTPSYRSGPQTNPLHYKTKSGRVVRKPDRYICQE